MESTAHISAVIVPTVLACGGDARAYLAGAGAMARIGAALGWSHYAAGWHATCTSGAPGAGVAAAVAMGLDVEQTVHAIVLSVPAAGGVQRAFGSDGKPGEALSVRWIGDAAGDFSSQVTLPTDGQPEAGLLAQDAAGLAPSPNMVRVIDLPNALEAEPNDEVAKATASGAAPLALNGIIEKEADIDFFKFTAKKGQQLEVRVYARKPLRSAISLMIW